MFKERLVQHEKKQRRSREIAQRGTHKDKYIHPKRGTARRSARRAGKQKTHIQHPQGAEWKTRTEKRGLSVIGFEFPRL